MYVREVFVCLVVVVLSMYLYVCVCVIFGCSLCICMYACVRCSNVSSYTCALWPSPLAVGYNLPRPQIKTTLKWNDDRYTDLSNNRLPLIRQFRVVVLPYPAHLTLPPSLSSLPYYIQWPVYTHIVVYKSVQFLTKLDKLPCHLVY